jgi:hypothetical protein
MRKILVCVVIALFALVISPSANNFKDEAKASESYGTRCPYDGCSCYFVRYDSRGSRGTLKVVRCGCCGREFIED